MFFPNIITYSILNVRNELNLIAEIILHNSIYFTQHNINCVSCTCYFVLYFIFIRILYMFVPMFVGKEEFKYTVRMSMLQKPNAIAGVLNFFPSTAINN